MKKKKEKWIKRNEDNLRDLQDNIKCYNIRIIGVPEEDRQKVLKGDSITKKQIQIKENLWNSSFLFHWMVCGILSFPD